jgi:hypothetical protein
VPTSGAFGTPKTLGNPSHQAGHGSSKKKAKR